MDHHTARTTPDRDLVVITADAVLLDGVLSVTAAVGVEPWVVSDPSAMRPLWSSASTILVGIDQAADLAAMVLPRRAGVYVLGAEHNRDQVLNWSLPLGAAVLTLPEGTSLLADVLADPGGQATGGGELWCVVGGSGGVGASTCAAGLAWVSSRAGARTMLVDADPYGGGLDLLVGAERVDGWRWPRLATARGHLGDLSGQLPQVDRVDILSMARGESGVSAPDAEQMTAVLLSALRSHRLTVVDIPRGLGPAPRAAVRRSDRVLLLVHADIRGIAASRELLRELEPACRELVLVVRLGRSASLDAETVATGLGLPLVGTIAEEPGLVVAAECGDPPGRSVRSPLARTCREILDDRSGSGVPA